MKPYINIFLGMCLTLSFNSWAQENQLEVINHRIDNERVFEVRGFTPGSDIALYSETGGGELLKKLSAPDAGPLIFKVESYFQPAFVLNMKDENINHIKGHGKVTFIGEDEFLIKNLAIGNFNNLVEISWQAKINAEGNYCFEILKSAERQDYAVAHIMPADAALSSYVFTDDGTGASYKIRLVNNNVPRYTSPALHSGTRKPVEIYPSPASAYINVIVKETVENQPYYITNSLGQVQQHDNISGSKCRINIESLPPGVYFLHLADRGKAIDKVKFVKL